MLEKIDALNAFITDQKLPKTSLGVILGTGLETLAEQLEVEHEIPYQSLPGFPTPTMAYHAGKLLFGRWQGQALWVCQGRFHAYEGYSLFEVTLPVRLLALLGVQTLWISNAAGAINPTYKKGELMLLQDHINLQGGSPLAYPGIESLGPRFVDMQAAYAPALRERFLALARQKKLTLHTGVYAAVVGPQLETAAEYRYLSIIGADAVGMSTVPEVIVARQLALEVVAFSVLTDVCDPDDLQPLDIPDIMAQAKKGEAQLLQLLQAYLETYP